MERGKFEIVGAWLKGGLFCIYKYQQKKGKDSYEKGKVDDPAPCHDHLRFAFAALAIHMPVILQELAPEKVPDINSAMTGTELDEESRKLVGLFSCTGFEHDPQTKAVRLIGTKALDLGALEVRTPWIMFEGAYRFALELRMMVDHLINEVMEYKEGKYAIRFEEQDMYQGADPIIASANPDDKPKKRLPKGTGKKGRTKKEQETQDDGGELVVEEVVISETGAEQSLSDYMVENGEIVEQIPREETYDPEGVKEREKAYLSGHKENEL